MRILLVEDDSALVECMEEIFNIFSVKYLVAKNIEDGVKALKEFDPDIILLDLLLDGILGIPLIEEARKKEKPPKVVIFSALRQARDIAEEYKADYFLSKPFELESIEEIILNKFV